MGKPRAPRPPNPRDVSAAATGGAVNTAIANTTMGNVNQVGPNGSLTYNQSGSSTMTDPYTGQTYQIPQFTATTTLSPGQQALLDQSTANQGALGRNAATMLGGMNTGPIEVPQFQTSAGLETNFGSNDYSADRQRVERALMDRMQPGLQRDQEALNASLANQGIGYGAEAYGDAQYGQGQRVNDARMSAILAGGQEQERMFNMDTSGRAARNAARQAEFGNFNAGTAATFGADTAARSQTMQQIMQMLGASQPSIPNYQPNRPSAIPTTDNAGIINANYGQQQQNYQQQMAGWQNMIGNLFGIGAAAVGG